MKIKVKRILKKDFSDAISFIGRKLNKSLRSLDRRWRTNVQDKMSDISLLSKSNNEDKPKRVKCFEYEGFGHIKTECPNFLRNKKRDS